MIPHTYTLVSQCSISQSDIRHLYLLYIRYSLPWRCHNLTMVLLLLVLATLHSPQILADLQPLLSLSSDTVSSPACARPEFVSCQLATINWDLLNLSSTFQLPTG